MPPSNTITYDDFLKAIEELERVATPVDPFTDEWGAYDVVCKNGYIVFYPKGLLKKAGWDSE